MAARPGGDLAIPQLLGKEAFPCLNMGMIAQKSTQLKAIGKIIFSLLAKLYMMAPRGASLPVFPGKTGGQLS
jgi:hypothetical protein